MVNKKPGLLICFIFLSFMARGQQAPLITQYMLNKYAINPAFGGLEKSLSLTAAIRTQWTQLPGAPSTQSINAHLPLYFLQGSVGMDVLNDQIGATATTRLSASYNYVKDTPYGLFSIGVKAGFHQVRLRSAELRTPSGIYQDQAIDHRDPLLGAQAVDGFAPVWGIGIYYAGNQVEFGFALDNPGNTSVAGPTAFRTETHWSLFGSYDLPINELVTVIPSFLLRRTGGQLQTEAGVIGHYTNYLGGITLRGYDSTSLDAINVIAGARISKHIRVSYSFDLGLSALRSEHDGTHEFTVNYNLARKIRTGELPKIIYNPRFH